ncbi:MAG: hypothetical protein AB1405_17885, partial [Bdellovibrionota bacterium]
MPCPHHPAPAAPAPSEEALALLRSAEFVQKVCDAVEKKGATPHVIAFAEGFSLEDFWLVWGLGLEAQKKKDKSERGKLFSDFVLQVQRALARARVEAEKRVFEKSPHIYLGSSPACTGGFHWKRKNSEPLSPEELFQRSGAWYLRHSEACTSGPYCLDPTPPAAPPEPEAPCKLCEEAAQEKRTDFIKELLRQIDEKIAREKAEESSAPFRENSPLVSCEPHPQPLPA